MFRYFMGGRKARYIFRHLSHLKVVNMIGRKYDDQREKAETQISYASHIDDYVVDGNVCGLHQKYVDEKEITFKTFNYKSEMRGDTSGKWISFVKSCFTSLRDISGLSQFHLNSGETKPNRVVETWISESF